MFTAPFVLYGRVVVNPELASVGGGLKDVLLGPAQLYEALRAKAESAATAAT